MLIVLQRRRDRRDMGFLQTNHSGSRKTLTMPPSKEWTVARDLLKKDLKDGRISSDLPSAKEVYKMRSENKAVPWQRFRDNCWTPNGSPRACPENEKHNE